MIDTRRLDAAVRGVLNASIGDYRKGAISREDLEEFARRRANGIRANYVAAAQHVDRVACKSCRTIIAETDAACIDGLQVCKTCAPRFRNTPRARRAA